MEQNKINFLNENLISLKSIKESMDKSRLDGKYEHFGTYWRLYRDIFNVIEKSNTNNDFLFFYYFNKIIEIPNWADCLLPQNKEHFETIYSIIDIAIKHLELFLNKINKQNNTVLDFINWIYPKIRKCVFNKPDKEKVIQDIIEQILIGGDYLKDIDYGRETGKIDYSSKEYIPDFIIHKLDLVIEIKICTSKEKTKRIIDEMNADILPYSKKFKNILFIVYDLGHIINEDEYRNDVDNNNNIFLRIIKH